MAIQNPGQYHPSATSAEFPLAQTGLDIGAPVNPMAPDYGGFSDLPFVQAPVFARHPNASYHVGLLAVGDDIVSDAGYTAARQLRFQVYNNQGWLDYTARDPDGGEHDRFDAHSAQFGVIKQTVEGPKMIATSRLILKTTPDTSLPVEEDFPEVFAGQSLPVGDTEISRLISASVNKKERALASLALQRVMIGWGNDNGYYRTHAMVEGYLLRRLQTLKIPLDQRSDFKPIAEYADTENALISIDSKHVLDRFKHQWPTSSANISTALFFRNIARTRGLGFYGKHFVRRYK